MAGPSSLTGARRDVVAIVEKSVSIGLARWIDTAFRDGADLAEIEQMLTGALRQIGRVNRHWQAGTRIPACEAAA